MNFLLVFLGGGLGAALRYGVSLAVPGHRGTWIVNILGSFALAWLTARASSLSPALRLALGTGVMGGFTTYSTFNTDTLKLVQQDQLLQAALNLGVTVVVCLLAGVLGWWLGRPQELPPG